jgi:hypothetical protein
MRIRQQRSIRFTDLNKKLEPVKTPANAEN